MTTVAPICGCRLCRAQTPVQVAGGGGVAAVTGAGDVMGAGQPGAPTTWAPDATTPIGDLAPRMPAPLVTAATPTTTDPLAPTGLGQWWENWILPGWLGNAVGAPATPDITGQVITPVTPADPPDAPVTPVPAPVIDWDLTMPLRVVE